MTFPGLFRVRSFVLLYFTVYVGYYGVQGRCNSVVKLCYCLPAWVGVYVRGIRWINKGRE